MVLTLKFMTSRERVDRTAPDCAYGGVRPVLAPLAGPVQSKGSLLGLTGCRLPLEGLESKPGESHQLLQN
jgi:hypothetical protein